MSILSRVPDGMGYHYGFRDGDHRQINIRRSPSAWDVYVGGEWVAQAKTKEGAEKLALEWMDENPPHD